jgi:hypothetical protein
MGLPASTSMSDDEETNDPLVADIGARLQPPDGRE